MQSGITREVAAAGGQGQWRRDASPRTTSTRAWAAASTRWPPARRTRSGSTLPETSDAGQLGGALLAYVLLGKGQRTDVTQVLGAFSALHMITLDSSTITPSTLVVVIGHGSKPAKDYGIKAELSLVAALARAGGHVVVAGDSNSAAGGGLVGGLRAAADQRGAVSTVDDADNAFGQVSAVLALAAAEKGQLGHYGTENGADALFPSPSK